MKCAASASGTASEIGEQPALRRAGGTDGDDRGRRAAAEAELDPALREVVLEDKPKPSSFQPFLFAELEREPGGAGGEAQLFRRRAAVPDQPRRPMDELYISHMLPRRVQRAVHARDQRRPPVEHRVFAGEEDLPVR